jgi:hypothetical protein
LQPELGPAHAKSTSLPGSAETQMKSISGEPGSLDAWGYELMMVLRKILVYINWY